jgi:hypothetical protein
MTETLSAPELVTQSLPSWMSMPSNGLSGTRMGSPAAPPRIGNSLLSA